MKAESSMNKIILEKIKISFRTAYGAAFLDSLALDERLDLLSGHFVYELKG